MHHKQIQNTFVSSQPGDAREDNMQFPVDLLPFRTLEFGTSRVKPLQIFPFIVEEQVMEVTLGWPDDRPIQTKTMAQTRTTLPYVTQ